MRKNIFVMAAMGMALMTASCGSKQTNENAEAADSTATVEYLATLDQVKDTLTAHGYGFELHPLVGYFQVLQGEAGSNLDLNPDMSINFFLYNRGERQQQADLDLQKKVVETTIALGYKDEGPGNDGSDNHLVLAGKDTMAEAEIEQALKDAGFEVHYNGLVGGGYVSILTVNGQPNKNGKSNVNINEDGTFSFFSDGLDPDLDAAIVKIAEGFGWKDTGRGADGSTHYFRP
jgi:hypothetical protein